MKLVVGLSGESNAELGRARQFQFKRRLVPALIFFHLTFVLVYLFFIFKLVLASDIKMPPAPGSFAPLTPDH